MTPPKSRLRTAGCAASMGLAVVLAGCSRTETAPVEPADVAQTGLQDAGLETDLGGRGKNVILISVDTTRADYLACYGHPESLTPNIDQFAAEGTRFAWCISSVPLTLPSHTTMLTGSYPYVHGVRDNGIFIVGEGNVLLPEMVKPLGYATHAQVSAVVLHKKYGMAQGFDEYVDIEPQESELKRHAIEPSDEPAGDKAPDAGGGAVAIEMQMPEVEQDRKGDDITDSSLAWLAERAGDDQPFFMFIHYFDPHWPYEAPEPFAAKFPDDTYLGEIHYFDYEFGRLIDGIRELGLTEDTLVMLTSDHGEGRGSHGEMTHSTFLYDDTLHVPFIMWGGGIPADQVVESQVRLVDIAPTVVDYLDLERTEQMQGVSLLPLVEDPELDAMLSCYSETLVPQNSLNYSPLRSWRTDDWKFILAPRNELYDLENDIDELFNIASTQTEIAGDMRQQMWDLIADSPPAPGGRANWRAADADEVRKLAALGYVSATAMQDPALMSGTELDHFEPVGINPRDRLEVIECWAAGLGAYNIGEFEGAEVMFRRFLELEPDNAVGMSYLGRILMHQQRYEESITMFRRALTLNDTNFMDFRSLGTLLLVQGDHDEAARNFRKAIELEPGDPAAHLNLGLILAARGAQVKALEHIDIAVGLAPEEPRLHLQRGIALRVMGRFEESKESLLKANELDPEYVRPYEQLALCRHQMGDRVEAIELLKADIERMPTETILHKTLGEIHLADSNLEGGYAAFTAAIELDPNDDVAHMRLGGCLVMLERYDEAIEHLRRALELRPDLPLALFELAYALDLNGQLSESVAVYNQFLELKPRHVLGFIRAADANVRYGDAAAAVNLLRKAYATLPDNITIINDLAWRLATVPDASLRAGEEAVKLAESANSVKAGESCNELDTLAAAYAAVGRFEEAISAAERALMIAQRTQQDELAASINARLDLFRAGQPYYGN